MSRIELVLPRMGESVEEGTITAWHVEEGQSVRAGEVLVDVSTDKVETEIEAPTDCTIEGITAPEGTTVEVGARLAWLVTADAADAATAPTADGVSSSPAAEPPRAVVSSPAEVPSHATAGPEVAAPTVGSPDSSIEAPTVERDVSVVPLEQVAPLSPVVRCLLAQHGLGPFDVTGTGRRGRITRSDVLAATSAPPTPPRPPMTAPALPAAATNPIPTSDVIGRQVMSPSTAARPIDYLHVTVDLSTIDATTSGGPSRRACLVHALARTLERRRGALGWEFDSIGVDGRRLGSAFDLRLGAIDVALEQSAVAVDETVEIWDLVDSGLAGACRAPATPSTMAVFTVQPPRPEIVTGASEHQFSFSIRSASTITLAIRADVGGPHVASELLVALASEIERTARIA